MEQRNLPPQMARNSGLGNKSHGHLHKVANCNCMDGLDVVLNSPRIIRNSVIVINQHNVEKNGRIQRMQ